MIIINNDNFLEDKHSYLFPGQFPSGRLPEGISISYQEYRYEKEYVANKHAALSALLEISRCSVLFAGMKLYAVVGEIGGRPTGRVRSYKGWIPDRSPLKHLEHRRMEVFLSEKSSKLGAVFSISNPIPMSGAEYILNSRESALVMSTLDIDGVCALAAHWLSGDSKDGFALDYDKIGKALVENENLLIIRLIGPSCGRRERVIVANGGDRHSHQIHSFLSSLVIVWLQQYFSLEDPPHQIDDRVHLFAIYRLPMSQIAFLDLALDFPPKTPISETRSRFSICFVWQPSIPVKL